MPNSSRSSILITLIMLTACGGGGSGSADVLDTTDSDGSAEETIVDTGSPTDPNDSAEPAVTAGSTEGTLCDYNDSTFNSQPSLTYTSTSQWTCTTTIRQLSANGIPDHDVGAFPNANNPNTISEQTVSASYTLEPRRPPNWAVHAASQAMYSMG